MELPAGLELISTGHRSLAQFFPSDSSSFFDDFQRHRLLWTLVDVGNGRYAQRSAVKCFSLAVGTQLRSCWTIETLVRPNKVQQTCIPPNLSSRLNLAQ
jgi:hypothetical protein